jgi:hypothetical protein
MKVPCFSLLGVLAAQAFCFRSSNRFKKDLLEALGESAWLKHFTVRSTEEKPQGLSMLGPL